MKTAIVTGLTGQDGSYLADQLIEEGIKVYGLVRRTSRGTDLGNANHLQNNSLLEVVEGDITDLPSLIKLCNLAKADYFLHTAAQSHVGTSFSQPVYTAQCTGIGTLNCLEAIRVSGYHTRFLNCATSELFGGISSEPCNEETPFYPRSPYGVAKLFGHHITVNYRESYKMFACSSICFNHESRRRSDTFVTRKISKAVAHIKKGLQDKLFLGNLDARRDWGDARDYVRAMILMLQKSPLPKDYVIATGVAHSVRDFCDLAFKHVGLNYQQYVEIDPTFYRPAEVDVLVGDASAIKKDLGWKPECSFGQLVEDMVDWDMGLLSDQQGENIYVSTTTCY